MDTKIIELVKVLIELITAATLLGITLRSMSASKSKKEQTIATEQRKTTKPALGILISLLLIIGIIVLNTIGLGVIVDIIFFASAALFMVGFFTKPEPASKLDIVTIAVISSALVLYLVLSLIRRILEALIATPAH